MIENLGADLLKRFSALFCLPVLDKKLTKTERAETKNIISTISADLDDDRWLTLFVWAFLSDLAGGQKEMPRREVLFDQWRISAVLSECLIQIGRGEWKAEHLITTVKVLSIVQGWYQTKNRQDLSKILSTWLETEELRLFLDINEHDKVMWFNQEALDELIWWLIVLAVIGELEKSPHLGGLSAARLKSIGKLIEKLKSAEKNSDFRLDRLLNALKK